MRQLERLSFLLNYFGQMANIYYLSYQPVDEVGTGRKRPGLIL